MNYLHYQDETLFFDHVSLQKISQQFGTPTYVYAKRHIQANYQTLHEAFQSQQHMICFAIKANSNLAVLQTLAELGSGFDVVSKGEIYRALKAGADPQKIVFSGVGKSVADITYALEQNILCINVESWQELERINAIALQKNIIAPIGFRVNPNVDAKTHPHIATGLKTSKFGIPIDNYLNYAKQATQMSNVNVIGISCHIGSQITQTTPFKSAVKKMVDLYHTLQQHNINLQLLNIGGGMGVCYNDETPFSSTNYANTVLPLIKDLPVALIIEPGRSLVANTGVLLTKIEYIKRDDPSINPFIIVDAGMNDLIRPMLYDTTHQIQSIDQKTPTTYYDIVGPVCESTDVFAKNIQLPNLQQNDLLVLLDTGAYGFGMSSNYNTRPRACEIMVDGTQVDCIRERESIDQLILGERTLT